MKTIFQLIIKLLKDKEFLRFCIVGIISTLIDALVFYIAIMITTYMYALFCGYFISLFINYVLTVIWTFKLIPNFRSFIGVFCAHLANLFIVRMGLMFLFVEIFYIKDNMAYFPTVAISSITNFIIIRYIVKRTN